MSARDFLVEIGTEELPPKSLLALSEAFRDGLVAAIDALGIKHGKVQLFATPRRLAVLVARLAETQPDQVIRRKGPPVSAAFDASGAPTRAAQAFAQSNGVAVDALERVAEPKGEFLYFSGVKPGAPTVSLLPGCVEQSLAALPIAKRMRWGAGDAEFVRPAHWVVMLFGRDVVPCTILGLAAGNLTRGHRFHAPAPFKLSTPKAYAGALAKRGKVIASFDERRERVRAGVTAEAERLGGIAEMPSELLDEVTALVEWPVPVAGRFEERFLALPPEVLTSTLKDHQRYFPVRDASHRLLPWFITVANIESADPAQVRAGNERVVRPRLSDAAFFFDADRKQPLAARREALGSVTFQAQLGSYADKVARVRWLAVSLASSIGANPALAERASELAKCDLLTGMVGEFPELQGLMGRYYAELDGEPTEVAVAIAEQYLPRFAGDALPTTGAGRALAIADKLDTIVGIFAIGQKPTGAKDPFGLRRAALGVLRIVIEQGLEVDLVALIAASTASFEPIVQQAAVAEAARAAAKAGKPATAEPASQDISPRLAALQRDVYDYMMERLRAYFVESDASITTEQFDAVLATRPASPVDFASRLKALSQFLALDAAPALAAANKRIANLLKKAGERSQTAVDVSRLAAGPEQALHAALARVSPDVSASVARREYAAALARLATLRPEVDAFFDGVMVMDPDAAVRANRLALLGELAASFGQVADLSLLPG